MKKLLSAVCSVLCMLCCLLCACGWQSGQMLPPQFPLYMNIELPREHFNDDEDVTFSVLLGSPNSMAYGAGGMPDLTRKVIIVITNKLTSINEQPQQYYTVKKTNDFTSYVCEVIDGEAQYEYSEQVVVSDQFYAEDSGRFYCSLYASSSDDEEYFGDCVKYAIMAAIDYKKVTAK